MEEEEPGQQLALHQEFIDKLSSDPAALFARPEKSKAKLNEVLQSMFKQLSKKKTNLVFEGFGLDQVWTQLMHYTDRVNQSTISKLSALISSEDFIRSLEADSTGNSGDESEPALEEEEADEYGDEYGSEGGAE